VMKFYRLKWWVQDQGFGDSWFLRNTLCRFGHHCRPQNRIKKFDGGRCPALCYRCRLIVGNWRGE
jgi:hypothetical protein